MVKQKKEVKKEIYNKLLDELLKIVPSERIYTDELNKLAFGTDASFYRLIPEIVVKVRNRDEAQYVIKKCNELNVPVTFRAAGTSLSGQAISNSVLMVADRTWRGYKIADDKDSITLDPMVLGSFANAYLKPYNKKIGPDPASIEKATIGGIAANNASGMTSGTIYNIFNTLIGMEIVFSDGSVLNTTDEKSKDEFSLKHPEFLSAIKQLAQEVKENEQLAERIEKKYRMKNTTGYSLNALTEYDDPFDIIAHLMIGSEGTLGFITSVKLRTLDISSEKATALIIFKDTKSACEAIPIFQNMPVDAAEIMDRMALKSVENKEGMPEELKGLQENATALLIQISSNNSTELEKYIEEIKKGIEHLPKEFPVKFTSNPKKQKILWDVRKGLFPSVCAARKSGTTVIIEDVNFPIEQLADAVLDLKELFKKHQYNDTIIWGHSLAGNIHFVFAVNFESKKEVKRYEAFMNDVTRLVVKKYDGSLKAEHGTGRNMAPFVEYEWGNEAYEIMKKIKTIFDPSNILNPGVLLNDDKNVFIKNLKPTPVANPIIDKCIECGFCENTCPSKELTLTPRQRITSYREIIGLTLSRKDEQRRTELIESFKYYGEETCATDGLCALDCPVGIDTGKLIKELRAEQITPAASSFAELLANKLAFVTAIGKIGLNAVHSVHLLLGTNTVASLVKLNRKILGRKFPLWNQWMPKAADKLLPEIITEENPKKVVYFPSCISRTMGNPKGSKTDESLTTVTHRLLRKAGYDIIYPENLNNLCCGMPWLSKGHNKTGNKKTDELITQLIKASENGKYPILYDTSPCLQTTKNRIEIKGGNQLKLYEPVEFISDYLLDELELTKQEKTITVHVTCSSRKMGLTDKFIKVAEACATDVIIPENVTCCGFAGDRGFNFPELNESALKDLKPQLTESCHEGYSNSKTCEIGLSYHSGIEYRSIVYLVDECCK
jgi:D-lactate dehydrogenase